MPHVHFALPLPPQQSKVYNHVDIDPVESATMGRTKGAKKKQSKPVKKKSDFAIGSGLTSNCPSRTEKSTIKRKRKHIRMNEVGAKKSSVKVKLHSNTNSSVYAVPWWRDTEVEKDKKETSGSKTSTLLLNGFTVKEATLQHLNKELALFGEYVKLSSTERNARLALIGTVKGICKELFGIDQAQCQIFGSFAAPSVCTFGSDIDMAIWGVVATDDTSEGGKEQNTRHCRNRSISLADSEESHSGNEERDNPQQRYEHPNCKKEESVLRWKNAIDLGLEQMRRQMAEDDGNDSGCKDLEGGKNVAESEQAGGEMKAEQNHQQRMDTGSDLFVLDRIGVEDIVTKEIPCAEDQDYKQEGHEMKMKDDNSRGSSIRDMDSEDDEVDDADKLEALWWRRVREGRELPIGEGVPGLPINDGSCDEAVEAKRPRGESMVSLSSATICSHDVRLDDLGMEVSYIVGANSTVNQVSGPTGKNRTAVVNALYKIARRLKPYATTLHVRKKASKYKSQIWHLSS